jgi:hypothetical protein
MSPTYKRGGAHVAHVLRNDGIFIVVTTCFVYRMREYVLLLIAQVHLSLTLVTALSHVIVSSPYTRNIRRSSSHTHSHIATRASNHSGRAASGNAWQTVCILMPCVPTRCGHSAACHRRRSSRPHGTKDAGCRRRTTARTCRSREVNLVHSVLVLLDDVF